MKVSKKILAVIMAVCMMSGIASLGFTAMAAPTLQDQINAAAAGDTVTVTRDITATVVIDKDLTLDLGDKAVYGSIGTSTITVTNGATVTIKNGRVHSYFKSKSIMVIANDAASDCKPPIKIINGAEVLLSNIVAVGTLITVPGTSRNIIPAGNAVEVSAGCSVTVRKSVLVGRYGISNAEGAVVYIEDGAFAGFLNAIKRLDGVNLSADTMLYNFRENLDRLFPENIDLTDDEASLIKSVLGNRALLYLNNPVNNITTNYEDGILSVVAKEDFSNRVSDTEMGYTWVPEYVTVQGHTYAFTRISADEYSAQIPATLTVGENASMKMRYRCWLQVTDKIAGYIVDGPEMIKDIVVNDLDGYVDRFYGMFEAKYEEIVAMLGDVFFQLDTLMAEGIEIDGYLVQGYEYFPEIVEIQKDLFLLGGGKMGQYINDNKMYFEWAYPGFYEYLGLDYYSDTELALDTVEELKAEFDVFVDAHDYAGGAYWLYENYQAFIDVADLATTYIKELQADIDNDMVAQAVEIAGLGEYTDLINSYADQLDELNTYVQKVFNGTNATVNKVLNKLESLDGDSRKLEEYLNKGLDVLENIDTYINFTVVNNSVKLIWIEEEVPFTVTENVEVELSVSGVGGTVHYFSDIDNGLVNNNYIAPYVPDTGIIIEAVEQGGEFLYWVNTETDRIVSTNPALSLASSIDSKLEAVFNNPEDGFAVTYATPTGDRVGVEYYMPDDTTVYVPLAAPVVSRLDFVGWPETEDDCYFVDDLRGLATNEFFDEGDTSPFANPNASYMGKILSVRIGDQNNFIVTPNYTSNAQFTVQYTIGEVTQSISAEVYSNVVIEAPAENFSYWADAETGEVISLFSTYEFQMVDFMSIVAVYNEPVEVDAVTRIVKTEMIGTDKLAFYVERSVSPDAVLYQSGIIMTYDGAIGVNENDFVIGADNVIKGTAKFTTNQGLYVPYKANYIGAAIYARAYVEYEVTPGVRVILYSDITSVNVA